MRWAEGHSNNVKRMFTRLLFGRWVNGSSNDQISNFSNYSKSAPNTNGQNNLGQLGIRSIRNSGRKQKIFIKSPLNLSEKLEFLYLSPYYLQAFLFFPVFDRHLSLAHLRGHHQIPLTLLDPSLGLVLGTY